MKKQWIFGLLAGLGLAACSSDDDSGSGVVLDTDFRPGYWVLNEGGFGTIDYLNYDLSIHTIDAFTQVNGLSEDLGQYAQSMFFHGENAYIISNGSNKITVINRSTMQYVATIAGDLAVPRYGVVVGNYAYVTNSNSFASYTDDYVAKINLSTHTVESKLFLNTIAERILAIGNTLYIGDGFFGEGDGIVKLDLSTGDVSEIQLTQAPNTFQTDGTYLYVLTGDYMQNYSQLFKIRLSDNQIVASVQLGDDTMNATNLNLAGNELFFNVGKSIYRYSTELTNLSEGAFITVQTESNFAGYGFNLINGLIFVGNSANDFSSNGELKIYDLNGNLQKELSTGVGPNGIYDNTIN